MAALAYLDSLGEYKVCDFFFKYNFYSVLVILLDSLYLMIDGRIHEP
jgi:hypothetical protein